MMRILIIHNRYLQPGGEDGVVASEAELLRRHGHTVCLYEEDNRRIAQLGQFRTAIRAIWSRETNAHVRRLIREEQPDVVHIHNFFPLISPSAHYAARRANIPVIQTLHNFRLSCLNACLCRRGAVCEDCLGRIFAWPGVYRRCYRDSLAGSMALATMLAVHRALGTWRTQVSVFIALSDFARTLYPRMGIPPDKIALKPNFLIDDPGPGREERSRDVVFVGRLSKEKGIETLLTAWTSLKTGGRLLILGDGPMLEFARRQAAAYPHRNMVVAGYREKHEVLDVMRHGALLVFPSLWYEGMPNTIIEAMACGTPVLASRLGGIPEMIQHGKEGWLFRPGDPTDLAALLDQRLSSPDLLKEAGAKARLTFEKRYTAEANYRILMAVYERARSTSAASSKEPG